MSNFIKTVTVIALCCIFAFATPVHAQKDDKKPPVKEKIEVDNPPKRDRDRPREDDNRGRDNDKKNDDKRKPPLSSYLRRFVA